MESLRCSAVHGKKEDKDNLDMSKKTLELLRYHNYSIFLLFGFLCHFTVYKPNCAVYESTF